MPQGFAELAALGFGTVICVEAAEPEVEVAAGHGLAVYHVPIGYGIVDVGSSLRIAAAAHGAKRSVYVYSHDGGVRAATAAVLARRAHEALNLGDVLAALERAGVGRAHGGLRQSAVGFTPPDAAALERVLATVPDRVPPSGVAKTMVEIHDRWSRLQEWAGNGWRKPAPTGPALGGAPSPPIGPRYAGVGATEQARELAAAFGRTPDPDEVGGKLVVFRRHRSEAQAAARLLEFGLRLSQSDRTTSGYRRLEASCTLCHRAFRR